MNNDRISEITDMIDEMTGKLLIPVRTSKSIDSKAFDEFHKLLDEVIMLTESETSISKRLAGLLVFIYVSVNTEAGYTDYTSPVFQEAGIIEEYLKKVFGRTASY